MVHFISDIQDHIRKIQKVGAVSFPLLENNERVALLEEAKMQMYSKEEEYPGTHGVHQQMSVTTITKEQTPKLHAFVNTFEVELHRAFLSTSDLFLLERSLAFTERRVQKYDAGSIGITPHTDGARFRNIIALIILEGNGKLYVCDDRAGTNSKQVKTDPGYCVLMRAPGFMCEGIQPMHYVEAITADRYITGLRQVCPAHEQ